MKANLSLALAAASLLGASGCIVERERISDRARVPAPPPPDEGYAEPRADASAYADVPPPGAEVDEDVFYARLSPYGHWRWTPDYGRVWVPTVAYSWRPYTYGHWVLTDWGWTFASDDPWGWAAYHYGSWGYGPAFGWYWVPGRIWAPAWVSWRWGSGYACWAPIGPAGFVYAWSSPAWVVVPQQHFTRPIVGNVVAPQAAGPIVSQAQPLSGPHAAPASGRQFGPPIPQVQQAVGHPIAAVPARAVLRPAPAPIVGGGLGGQRGQAGQVAAPPQRGVVTRDAPRAGAVGPAPAPGPLRSPVPPRPPSSEDRPRYGASNIGRPYFPGGQSGQVPRAGQLPPPRAQGSVAPRPYGRGGQGSGGTSGGGYAPHPGSAPPAAPRAGGAGPAPHANGGGGAPAPSANRGGGRGDGHGGDRGDHVHK
jgi:hypothetical protein